MDKRIINENFIWDLHIHTCDCPKGSSEFSNLFIEEYLDKVIDVFLNYKDLKMISFTDHNFISANVYKAFIKRNTGISVIPGIEVDIYLDEESEKKNDFKHIIFYFDDRKFNFEKHAKMINDKINNHPIKIYDFLNFLITEMKDIPFLISPHFMKQESRSIDASWSNPEKTEKEIDKYMDQMFCFWEASGISNISRAIEFLKDFERKNKISIISFSDSNNITKLENYLKNPPQYFKALPNFEGLRMVGSDFRRICENKISINESDFGKYIGKIIQGDNEISFSTNLNTIVGGRGSGKSLLIDGIALYLNPDVSNEKLLLPDDRVDYIKNMGFKVLNLKDEELENHNFKFDYYNQGYVNHLFDRNSDIVSSHYFKDEFNKLEKKDAIVIKSSILQTLANKNIQPSALDENIVSITSKVKNIVELKKEFKLPLMKTNKIIDDLDASKIIDALDKTAVTPKELLYDTNVKKAKKELIKAIAFAKYSYNKSIYLSNENVNECIRKRYKLKLDSLNLERKDKSKVLDLIKLEINNSACSYINRVNLINSLLNLKYSDSIQRTTTFGYDNHKFIFQRELKIQPILNYLFEMYNGYFDSSKIKTIYKIDKTKFSSLYDLIKLYCYNVNDVIMGSKSVKDLDEELSTLKSLKINVIDEILIEDNGTLKNLRHLSPGTQANYLMEYIVFKDTSIPLLIDQPEDNIDNRTIYKVLTNWFEQLKAKRQIIVASHDPNIVINADSENIILCNQIHPNKFEYKNGALEYQDNIEKISQILDGGSIALKRRLIKYGEK